MKPDLISERQIHAATVDYLRLALRPGVVFHHSPNEGHRGWKAQRDINEMMQDTWRWQSANPNGFESV